MLQEGRWKSNHKEHSTHCNLVSWRMQGLHLFTHWWQTFKFFSEVTSSQICIRLPPQWNNCMSFCVLKRQDATLKTSPNQGLVIWRLSHNFAQTLNSRLKRSSITSYYCIAPSTCFHCKEHSSWFSSNICFYWIRRNTCHSNFYHYETTVLCNAVLLRVLCLHSLILLFSIWRILTQLQEIMSVLISKNTANLGKTLLTFSWMHNSRNTPGVTSFFPSPFSCPPRHVQDESTLPFMLFTLKKSVWNSIEEFPLPSLCRQYTLGVSKPESALPQKGHPQLQTKLHMLYSRNSLRWHVCVNGITFGHIFFYRIICHGK